MTTTNMTRSMRRITMAALNIVLLFSGLLNTSCRFEDDNYFNIPAGIRVQQTNKEIKSILTSASADGQYGWVIQYFVAGTDEKDFEGFNILGNFYDNGKVVLASNHKMLRDGRANTYTVDSSYYEMTSEDGCVLSFPTWNKILTVFEDPVDPTTGPQKSDGEEGGEDGEGIGGDHNLLMRKMSNDVLEFRGQRHQALVRFVRCDRPWEQYLQDVADFKSKVATSKVSNYYLICGADTMFIRDLYKGVFTHVDRVIDPLTIETHNCAFTPNGFYMGQTGKIKRTEFHGFTINEDSTFLVSENKDVKMVACWDEYILSKNDTWELDTAMFTAEQKDLLEQINKGVKKYNSAWSLKSIGLGKSTGSASVNGMVLTFYTNTQKTKTNTAGVALSQSRIALGEAKIVCAENATVDKNMETIEKKSAGFTDLCRQFAAMLNGNYVMTPDSYFVPAAVTYTSKDGGLTFKAAQVATK